MRTLRVLGGLWLDDGDSRPSSRGAQRRRLALLSLVALSPGRRITRDKALAMLWPENTSAEGRRRLSSAVYDLRDLLGDDALESAGDELSIAQSAELRTDAEEFESALARGDAEAALAVYGGPLLDGVHLSGAAEFEEWIASQRDRLQRQYLQALEQAASARLARGDATGATSAALGLLDAEPLSGHAALVAVNTLVAAGDRPQALRVAEAFAERVRRELAVEPDAELFQGLRTGPARPAAPASRTETSTVSAVPSPVTSSAAPPVNPPARPRVYFRTITIAALAIAALAGAAYRTRGFAERRESGGIISLSGLAANAARSTGSATALRAFLDGEAEYDSGRFDAAVKKFKSAVDDDSRFALAHLRLSESMLWQEQTATFAVVHDSLALRWSERLPRDDQLLVRAYVAWRRGEYSAADSLLRIVVPHQRDNPEAAFLLGEVLFHYNPLRGRPVGEATPWFVAVTRMDSLNFGARWHLLLLYATRWRDNEFRRQAAELAALPDGHVAVELRLFAADEADLPRLAASASPDMLFDAAWRRAVFRRDFAGAESLLTRLLVVGKELDYYREIASYSLASLRFARGRVRDASRLLDATHAPTAYADAWLLLVQGLIANRVDATVRLDTLAGALARWRQNIDTFGALGDPAGIVWHYADGLLAVERGDTAAAIRRAAELDAIAARGDSRFGRSPHDLAHTIRAYADLRAGRCESALRHLDAETSAVWLGDVAASPILAASFERYVRAECLLALGRNAEAGGWFETFEQNSIYDLEFLPAALRGQAAARRALGEPDAALALEHRAAAPER